MPAPARPASIPRSPWFDHPPRTAAEAVTVATLTALAAMIVAALVVAPAAASGEMPAVSEDDSGIARPRAVGARRTPYDLSLQVGWLQRAGGSSVRDDKASFLLVGDIFALWGPRPGNATDDDTEDPGANTADSPLKARSLTRRGLVVHLSGDDDGGRHGLGYVHRRYADARRHAYVQFSPVLILAANDRYRALRKPSAYISLQGGNDRTLAVCLALEIIRCAEIGYVNAPDDQGYWHSQQVIGPEVTQVNWHVGGVLHGWPGVVGIVALCVGVGVAMSSSGL